MVETVESLPPTDNICEKFFIALQKLNIGVFVIDIRHRCLIHLLKYINVIACLPLNHIVNFFVIINIDRNGGG